MQAEADYRQRIQQAYSRYLENRGLRARRSQREMIAAIARHLTAIETDGEGHRVSDASHLVIEAGTGTGKTLAYLLGALVLGQQLRKSVVVSTATVTLQQQILEREIPALVEAGELPVRAVLAKGRRRYLCLRRLDAGLAEVQSASSTLFSDVPTFTPTQIASMNETPATGMNRLSEALVQGWNGDVDHLETPVNPELWAALTVDNRQCLNRDCDFFHRCPYYLAKAQQEHADVIVANHDLLLADLALGGGRVLPPPEDCIYLIDEAHHLPDRAVQHFSASGSPAGLDSLIKGLRKAAIDAGRALPNGVDGQRDALEFAALVKPLESSLQKWRDILAEQTGWNAQQEGGLSQLRFPNGVIPENLHRVALDLSTQLSRVTQSYERILEALANVAQNQGNQSPASVARVQLAGQGRAMGELEMLFALFGREDPPGDPPLARWLSVRRFAIPESSSAEASREGDIRMHAAPLAASAELHDLLWTRAFSAVLCSATLAVAGDFSWFLTRVGLSGKASTIAFLSPFRFREQARLQRIDPGFDPSESTLYYDAAATALQQLIRTEEATLVLFSARKHLTEIHSRLLTLIEETGVDAPELLVQEAANREQILGLHRERIAAGSGSCLLGLASFAEGLDLPGPLLTHLIILRLPFPVPGDPVDATHSEWLIGQGRNPFVELALPVAALRLIQACGRLLRSETDTGTISILDRRLWQKRYGHQLSLALPDYETMPPVRLSGNSATNTAHPG